MPSFPMIPEQPSIPTPPPENGPVYEAAIAALSESFPLTAPWVVKQMLTYLQPVIVGYDSEGNALYRILAAG